MSILKEKRHNENNRNIIDQLNVSAHKVGKLYPVLEDYYGNIIDGRHRLQVDKQWPRKRLDYIKTKRDVIIVRLISNVCRRKVSAKEKTSMLNFLGESLLQEGTQPGEISYELARMTGMSYRWVAKYLPKKFKDESQLERASLAASHTAKKKLMIELTTPPKKKSIQIKIYSNTGLVFIAVEKPLYENIIKACGILNTTVDIFIQNILEENIRKIFRNSNLLIHHC